MKAVKEAAHVSRTVPFEIFNRNHLNACRGLVQVLYCKFLIYSTYLQGTYLKYSRENFYQMDQFANFRQCELHLTTSKYLRRGAPKVEKQTRQFFQCDKILFFIINLQKHLYSKKVTLILSQ